jgi:hypothetical protein
LSCGSANAGRDCKSFGNETERRIIVKHEQTALRRLLFAAALALGAVALMFSAAPVQAQATGATDIDITIPDIVILHYYGNVDITIGSNEFGTFLTGTPGDSSVDEGVAAPAAGGFTQDLAITTSGLSGDPTAAVLTLQNAWAVRAISLGNPGSLTELAVVVTDGVLDHATTAATMAISSATVNDGVSNAATITFGTPGMGNPQFGGVELTLDMTSSTDAGDYLDGVYTLTATNI